MKSIDVCLSPDLMHLFDVKEKVVVVADILRATSCMVTAFAHGIESIKPYADLESCRASKNADNFIAGERNGEKVEGFDLGNSPFEYMDPSLLGKAINMTTTNGTQAIEKSKEAGIIAIGAFLNLSALAEFVIKENRDLIIVCAGWKGKVNLEDTLFAGALAHLLKSKFNFACDAPMLAEAVYLQSKNDLVAAVSGSSHVQRLNRLNIHKDIAFCLTPDQYSIVPVMREASLNVI
jgi:2-phosphosulfolactate phosphatase